MDLDGPTSLTDTVTQSIELDTDAQPPTATFLINYQVVLQYGLQFVEAPSQPLSNFDFAVGGTGGSVAFKILMAGPRGSNNSQSEVAQNRVFHPWVLTTFGGMGPEETLTYIDHVRSSARPPARSPLRAGGRAADALVPRPPQRYALFAYENRKASSDGF